MHASRNVREPSGYASRRIGKADTGEFRFVSTNEAAFGVVDYAGNAEALVPIEASLECSLEALTESQT
jgi:hypothetical protein